jgi:hypothetical protein
VGLSVSIKPKKPVQAAAIRTFIRDIPVSKPRRDTAYKDRDFRCFPRPLQENSGSVLHIGPHPFQSVNRPIIRLFITWVTHGVFPDRLWYPLNLVSVLPPGVKRQGHEADHSSPSSAEVKNGGAIPPLPHMSSLYFVSFIKQRDNCTLRYLYLQRR